MIEKNDIKKIKRQIQNIIGCNVELKDNIGHKKIVVRYGVIEGAYPSIFVIRTAGKNNSNRISYSYTDILTHTVEMRVQNDAV